MNPKQHFNDCKFLIGPLNTVIDHARAAQPQRVRQAAELGVKIMQLFQSEDASLGLGIVALALALRKAVSDADELVKEMQKRAEQQVS